MAVTYEEASKCPKCGQTGVEVHQEPSRNRSIVYTLHCKNERCEWFDTGWIIQVQSDGTIPEREMGPRAPKQFPRIPGMTKEKADAEVEAIRDDT